MKSVQEVMVHTVVIQKSKFICKLIPVRNIKEIKNCLQDVKKEFIGASHYCYAYICGNESRFCDDGEPSGTAGMPILNVLEKNELNYVLAIVIRYFGGIKLGASGLVRAYSNCVIETLKNSNLVTLVFGKEIIYTFPYWNEKQVTYLLQGSTIQNKTYQTDIIYQVHLSNELFEQIKNSLQQLGKIEIKQELLIPKMTL